MIDLWTSDTDVTFYVYASDTDVTFYVYASDTGVTFHFALQLRARDRVDRCTSDTGVTFYLTQISPSNYVTRSRCHLAYRWQSTYIRLTGLSHSICVYLDRCPNRLVCIWIRCHHRRKGELTQMSPVTWHLTYVSHLTCLLVATSNKQIGDAETCVTASLSSWVTFWPSDWWSRDNSCL